MNLNFMTIGDFNYVRSRVCVCVGNLSAWCRFSGGEQTQFEIADATALVDNVTLLLSNSVSIVQIFFSTISICYSLFKI